MLVTPPSVLPELRIEGGSLDLELLNDIARRHVRSDYFISIRCSSAGRTMDRASRYDYRACRQTHNR